MTVSAAGHKLPSLSYEQINGTRCILYSIANGVNNFSTAIVSFLQLGIAIKGSLKIFWHFSVAVTLHISL